MKEHSVYSNFSSEYDSWFDNHTNLYRSELLALGKAIPGNASGIEIGVGTGRFAAPFKIRTGVDPSESMAIIAESKGLKVLRGVAEHLPVQNESFDFALMVTTDCFLSNVQQAFKEVNRILKPGGEIIIGLIDKNSSLGKKYEQQKTKNKFYKDAHFHSTEELTSVLKNTGFEEFNYWQTLTSSDESNIEQPLPGYGKGSFVVIKAKKKGD